MINIRGIFAEKIMSVLLYITCWAIPIDYSFNGDGVFYFRSIVVRNIFQIEQCGIVEFPIIHIECAADVHNGFTSGILGLA